MLTTQEIRQLGNKEMMDELQKSRRELLKSQFDVRNGISKEVHAVKNLKRYIARLQTIAKEMKMEIKPASMGKAEDGSVTPEEKKTTKKAAAPKKAPAEKKEKAAKAPAKKTTKSTKK